MNEQLLTKFQQLLDKATTEDLAVIKGWMDGFSRKQTGEISTYLSAGLQMERVLAADYCKVSIPITPAIHNHIGIPHGGILAVLLDTAMGILANDSLPQDQAAVTTNLSIHYLAAAKEGSMHAIAHFSHKGRQTMVMTGEVLDSQGRKLAIGTGSFFITQGKRQS